MQREFWVYELVFQAMIKMFVDCNLVHGDLSEFNILYHNSEVYIIDVSQVNFVPK